MSLKSEGLGWSSGSDPLHVTPWACHHGSALHLYPHPTPACLLNILLSQRITKPDSRSLTRHQMPAEHETKYECVFKAQQTGQLTKQASWHLLLFYSSEEINNQ